MHWLTKQDAVVVADALEVPIQLFPFQFPTSDVLVVDPVRAAQETSERLAERALVRSGRLIPELVEAFRLLSTHQVAIAVLGTVEEHREIYARVSANGHRGVLAVMDGDGFGVQPLRAEELVRAAVTLLPAVPAGPGQSVTVTQPQASQPQPHDDEEGFSVPFVGSQDSQDAAAMRAAQEILRRRRTGAGYFMVSRVGPEGALVDTPALNWIDTEAGRYMVRTGRAQDGRMWGTYSPADQLRLDRQLTELAYG